MRSLLALLLLTTAAAAETKSAPVLTVATKIVKVTDSENKVEAAAIANAIQAVRAELDRCAKQTQSWSSATLTFEKGAVSIAGPSGAFGACITPPLKKVAVKGGGKVVVIVELAVIEKLVDEVRQRSLDDTLTRFKGLEGPKSTGVGVGTGTGTGAGKGSGSVSGDFVARGRIDTGDLHVPHGRSGYGSPYGPKEVRVSFSEPSVGDRDGNEIMRVIRSRAGIFKACYQKELNRSPGLAGKIVVRYRVIDDGTTASATIVSNTTGSTAVAECVRANVMRLKHEAGKGTAEITMPFTFSPGS